MAHGNERAADAFPSLSVPNMAALRRLLKKARPGTGEVARAIEASRFQITERGFTLLIMTCRKRRQWRKAVEIFTTMQTGRQCGGVRANFYTFSAVISVCCKSSACSAALDLFRDMKEATRFDSSLEPDAIVYRLIISACEKDGRLERVLELYHEMLRRGIAADEMALSCVLKAAFKRREWRIASDALDALNRVEARVGFREWYGRIIAAAAEDGDLHLVLEIFLTMQMVGLEPDSTSCHGVMRAIEVSRVPEFGLLLFGEMMKSGVHVELTTYTCLFRALLRGGFTQYAISILDLMKDHTDGASFNKIEPVLVGWLRNGRATLSPLQHSTGGGGVAPPTKETFFKMATSHSASLDLLRKSVNHVNNLVVDH